jgi:hypothetical protein
MKNDMDKLSRRSFLRNTGIPRPAAVTARVSPDFFASGKFADGKPLTFFIPENPGGNRNASSHPYTKTEAPPSAASTMEKKPSTEKECLPDGGPPSPINIPPGCAFRPRRPAAVPVRATQAPFMTRRHGIVGGVARHRIKCQPGAAPASAFGKGISHPLHP